MATRSSTESGFRQLAGEPGYLRFVGAATFARVADEMFSVGVVLLALERTGSAVVAGFLVAAITLPSLVTAPLLGAWLDLHGRRKALMMLNQVLASAALVAIALGSTVGALALVRLQRRYQPSDVVLASMVIFGVLMLSWPLAQSLPVALVLIAVASVADGPGLAATFGVRQDLAPRDLQGQIFTTAAGVKVGSFALGAALAGPLVTGIGSSGTIIVSATTSFVGAAMGWVLMRGRPRTPTSRQAAC